MLPEASESGAGDAAKHAKVHLRWRAEWPEHPMDTITFVVTVILVTASGALAPGPLFFATISYGIRSGKRIGLLFSASHSLIELAFIALLAFGLFPYAGDLLVKTVIGAAGGTVLLVLGAAQIVNSQAKGSVENYHRERSLLAVGFALTGLNPLFIVWWLTAGANLILLALEFGGFAGIFLLYVSHAWIDVVWLVTVSYLSKKGKNLLGGKGYRAIVILSGAALIFFGLRFLSISIFHV